MPLADEPPVQARRLLAGVLVVLAAVTAGWFWLARPQKDVTLPPPLPAAAAMAGEALSPAAPPSVAPLPAEAETAAPASGPAAASEPLAEPAVPPPPPARSPSPSPSRGKEPTALPDASAEGGSPAKDLTPSLAASRLLPPSFPPESQTARPRLKEPDPTLELFRLGVLYQQAGDHRRAIEQYRALLAIDPRHVAALNNLAVSLRHLGELEAAADLFERATTLDPTYDKAFTNLGVVQQLQERRDAAMASHLRALAINGRNWESAFDLGLLFWEAGELERASQFFLKVVSVRPYASAYYHLGLIAEHQGQRRDALQRYRQALQEREGAQADLTAEVEQRMRNLVGELRR